MGASTSQPQNWIDPVKTISGGLSPAQLSLYQIGQTPTPTVPAPTVPVATTPTTLAPTVPAGTTGGAPTTLNPIVSPTALNSNMYLNSNGPREVMPSPYQVGLYRHMIFRLLQQDDPELIAKLQTRVPPNALNNALVYLGQNQADALSSPLLNTAFNDDHARMGQVLDDLGAWLNELDRRQRIKMGIIGASAVEDNARRRAVILVSILGSMLLAVGLIFAIYKLKKATKK